MTIQQVIDLIIKYHPKIEITDTCDGFKCGNPSDECKGIVTTCAVTVDVIRKTTELGYNLIITHEPTFYTHMDKKDLFQGKNEVFDEKLKMLNDSGIAVWRDHDHIHAHKPDGIFEGVMKELGWQNYMVGAKDKSVVFEFPRTTVRELALFLQKKLKLNAVKVIGNVDCEISKVAVCGHVLPSNTEYDATNLLNDVDVIIPLELIDWTVTAYARDAGQLGKNKAIIAVGHFNMEELGMKYAINWLMDLISKDVPVRFIRSGDPYQYVGF